MTLNEALEKAAKLLRLATSTNPHEAALAASRAQEIMDRFKLSADAVNGAGGEIKSEEPIRDFASDPLDAGRKLDRWRGQLAMAIAAVNQAKVYRGHGGLSLSVARPTFRACVISTLGWSARLKDWPRAIALATAEPIGTTTAPERLKQSVHGCARKAPGRLRQSKPKHSKAEENAR